jgi:hypothetical protein
MPVVTFAPEAAPAVVVVPADLLAALFMSRATKGSGLGATVTRRGCWGDGNSSVEEMCVLDVPELLDLAEQDVAALPDEDSSGTVVVEDAHMQGRVPTAEEVVDVVPIGAKLAGASVESEVNGFLEDPESIDPLPVGGDFRSHFRFFDFQVGVTEDQLLRFFRLDGIGTRQDSVEVHETVEEDIPPLGLWKGWCVESVEEIADGAFGIL